MGAPWSSVGRPVGRSRQRFRGSRRRRARRRATRPFRPQATRPRRRRATRFELLSATRPHHHRATHEGDGAPSPAAPRSRARRGAPARPTRRGTAPCTTPVAELQERRDRRRLGTMRMGRRRFLQGIYAAACAPALAAASRRLELLADERRSLPRTQQLPGGWIYETVRIEAPRPPPSSSAPSPGRRRRRRELEAQRSHARAPARLTSPGGAPRRARMRHRTSSATRSPRPRLARRSPCQGRGRRARRPGARRARETGTGRTRWACGQ